jgi:hypothetical protein
MVVVVVLAASIGWSRKTFWGRGWNQNSEELSADAKRALQARLEGDWVANNVSSLIGPLKVEMVIRKNGSCHVNLWTSGIVNAQIRDKEGAYELKGDRICSEILKRGSCRYWFAGEKLMVEYKEGTIVRFERVVATGTGQTASAAVEAAGMQR